jgi:hypothetical protein
MSMKISTKISHARLRLKHSFLLMRVHKPAYYQFLVTLLLVFAIGGVIAGFFFFVDKRPAHTAEVPIAIKTYSISGQVTKVRTGAIEVEAPIVQIQKGKSTVVYQTKTVSTTSQTPVSFVNKSGQTAGPATVTDIEATSIVVVYTTQNPVESGTITAERIEIYP